MNQKTPFQKLTPKLRLEALVNSLIRGASIGFAAGFIAALITWFTSFNGLWTGLGAFLAVTLVASALFYYLKFRPTVLQNARRLDSMGLEERLVTMIEFSNDDSCMAKLQRSDAEAALNKIDKKQIKANFSRKLIAVFTVCCLLGSGMTTVAALGYNGIIPSGSELLEQVLPEEMQVFLEVTYLVEEGGEIVGETDQLVAMGENADAVLAVADDGYEFIGWDDGSENPARQDFRVTNHIVVMAIFVPIEEEEGEDDSGDEEGDDEGEDDSGEPGGEGQNQKPSDPENPEDENDDSESDDAGGKYDSYNQIIDGKTYYREHLLAAKADIEEFLKKYEDVLTEEEKAIILAYIGIV